MRTEINSRNVHVSKGTDKNQKSNSVYVNHLSMVIPAFWIVCIEQFTNEVFPIVINLEFSSH